jgi:hypothetical protein
MTSWYSGSRLTLVAAETCLALVLLASVSLAQKTTTDPAAAKPKPTPDSIKIGSVTFSGSVRARSESWNWFDTTAADPNYTFGGVLARISLSQQTAKFDWQVEGAFPFLINLPENSIAPNPQGQLGLGGGYFAANGKKDGSVNLKQAFVRFKGIGGDSPSSLRVGRFEFAEGSERTPDNATLATIKSDHIAHRLLGPFTFSHVGRSFDGVQYVRNTTSTNLTVLGARITEGVFQLNANKELDVDFYYGAFTKSQTHQRGNSDWRIFGLHYHDGRGALKTDNRPEAVRRADGDNIRLTTIGGHYISAIRLGEGTMDLLLWGAGQFGGWGLLDHRAGAIAIEGGYQLPVKLSPWIRVGYFRSSGDGDPNDTTHNTFFQVLPTPRIYARFPFYNLMNNQDTFIQLRLKPHRKVALRTDLRFLRLANANDLWYLGGGAFQKNTFGYIGRPSGGNNNLGTVGDVSVDYNVTGKTTLTFYAGGVMGGRVQGFVYPESGTRSSGRFIYFELVQRF